MDISLSEKQILFFEKLNDPHIVDILMGGGAGGSKSLSVCLWIAIACRNYQGIRIGLGRKELTKLKQTTVHTLINEAHKLLGVKENEYFYSEQKGTITYVNRSTIQLVDLAWLPSDPDYDRFGSLNFTHTVIEEAGEVHKKAKDVFHSRKNRYLNKKYSIVGKSVTTCNPSQNFLKQDYYIPFKKMGAGDFQQWEYGRVEIDGKMTTSYRCFIQSLATDNPFISRNYIEVLRLLPPAERRRLLEGSWDYADDDLILFKSALLDKVTTRDIGQGEKFIGVDISDTGGDDTILSLVEAGALVDQKAVEINKTEAIGEQIAMAIIKYAQQLGMSSADAHKIAIDGVGVGASTRDFMWSKGWRVRIFVAGGASTDPMFKNLRGETIYTLSQEMDKGNFKIYTRLPTIELLKDQLMAHEYTTEERTILVKSKKEIKEVLGRSPDHAESAYIAFWVSKGDNDERRNAKRISY